jgi:hypothetical protein
MTTGDNEEDHPDRHRHYERRIEQDRCYRYEPEVTVPAPAYVYEAGDALAPFVFGALVGCPQGGTKRRDSIASFCEINRFQACTNKRASASN